MSVRRRSVLVGGLGAAALAAVGIPVAEKLHESTPIRLKQLLAKKPFYIAHRGGSADWPECSMEAYRRSVAAGVDGLEISLARSADGVWFGLHDTTLDRTSGTTGFVAAKNTWAQINRHSIAAPDTGRARQAAQPYLRFEDLVKAYAKTHVIFVDPKAADPEYYPDLLDLMDAAGPERTQIFVAKYYGTGTAWAAAAAARGYTTWGFYYAADVANGSTVPGTQDKWDLLGMDVTAPATAWSSILGYRKPVIGFIIADKAQARTALADGARGLMLSGVREVLGGHT